MTGSGASLRRACECGCSTCLKSVPGAVTSRGSFGGTGTLTAFSLESPWYRGSHSEAWMTQAGLSLALWCYLQFFNVELARVGYGKPWEMGRVHSGLGGKCGRVHLGLDRGTSGSSSKRAPHFHGEDAAVSDRAGSFPREGPHSLGWCRNSDTSMSLRPVTSSPL